MPLCEAVPLLRCDRTGMHLPQTARRWGCAHHRYVSRELAVVCARPAQLTFPSSTRDKSNASNLACDDPATGPDRASSVRSCTARHDSLRAAHVRSAVPPVTPTAAWAPVTGLSPSPRLPGGAGGERCPGQRGVEPPGGIGAPRVADRPALRDSHMNLHRHMLAGLLVALRVDCGDAGESRGIEQPPHKRHRPRASADCDRAFVGARMI